MDILAHEYGWTVTYVLETLSKNEVFLMLSAISERYRKQNEAYEKAKDGGESGDMSEMSSDQFKAAGFNVK